MRANIQPLRLATITACLFSLATSTEAAEATTGVSGLPVPRFVSLKSDKVNLRSGPGTDYPTAWVFRRAGLPLEILKEYEGWRQVRDSDGSSGWVLQSFLSGRRTALIEPWEVKAGNPPPQLAIYADESEKATVVAKIEAGVIANVLSCGGTWCRIFIDPYKGYIQQKRLWGVYDTEKVK
jgi:SH3-like domain-containing protein